MKYRNHPPRPERSVVRRILMSLMPLMPLTRLQLLVLAVATVGATTQYAPALAQANAQQDSEKRSQPGAVAGAGNWGKPPACTPRKNKVYISPTGSDADGNGSKARPWATLMANVTRIVPDTEIIYADGLFPDVRGPIYSSFGTRPQIANNVTIRGANWQRTTLRGPTSGDAFTIFRTDMSNTETDLEICGLVLEGWRTGKHDNGGTGVFTVGGQVNGLRIVGNKVRDFGDTNNRLDHFIYLSEGPDYARTMRNIVIEWNDVSSYNQIGALLIHSWNNIAGIAARDVTVRYNKVRGSGDWGMIIAPFWAGGPANWKVYQNDIRIQAKAAVVHFFPYGGRSTTNGADPSFQIYQNTLQNANPDAMDALMTFRSTYKTLFLREDVTGKGEQHNPTIRDNIVWSVSGKLRNKGITPDASNKEEEPGKEPVMAAP